MKRRTAFISIFLLIVLAGCNFPLAQKAGTSPSLAATTTMAPLTGPGVRILSPADGTQIAAGSAVQVTFDSSGGPFIESDLLEGETVLASLPLDAANPAPAGTLTWTPLTGGQHTLTVELLTLTKDVYTANITVSVTGGTPGAATSLPGAATMMPTLDPARAGALTQVLQIFHDTYGLTVTAPPLARKYRFGVPNDAWVSVVYVKNWMYAISVYPDRVEQDVRPINMQSDGSVPLPPGEKATPICKPAGTYKLLVAFVDYQNLGVTRDQAFAALQTATQSINARFSDYSSTGGATSPILQLQTTPVFISPLPNLPDGLLTPEIVKSTTGVDPAAYDLLVQIDLDANNTRRKINASVGEDTNGLDFDACQGRDLSIWIGLDTVDQALDQDNEKTMERILSHEMLHTFGYPADHHWPATDGKLVDQTDQSDVYNWPTLMLGWTDTDGDGIPEILDPTPYGSSK